ncbi:MAG: zinc-ribbon domain-containing protein [Planctomycetes bacterium]|nr:zinc-ribbon domain-containing protein [Planctomycetota bacterium]
MLKLKCPFCGYADIDASRETHCYMCSRRLVGSLDSPYGWESADDAAIPNCLRCGTENSSHARFCRECGRKLSARD